MLESFQKALQSGVKDANAEVRKASRHMFWVLKSISMYEEKMDKMHENFDTSTKKHIKQELQNASEDFIELLNNPTGGLEDSPAEYLHSTPFEGKHHADPGASRPLSSSLERPPSLSRWSTHSALPPPLPAQKPKQKQGHSQGQGQGQTHPHPQSRQPVGPSRVAHSDRDRDRDRGHVSSSASAFSAMTSSNEFDNTLDNIQKDRSDKSSAGGSRRASMAPERVIRATPSTAGVAGSAKHSRPIRQGQDQAPPPAPSETPPPGPPALSISNSIRNKRYTHIALLIICNVVDLVVVVSA
jgi:hypothetical protein